MYADVRNTLYLFPILKRLLRNIILFLPMALCITVLLLWLLGGTGWLRNVTYRLGHDDHLHTKVLEARQVHDIDVLFLGSSHSYRTLDTRVYARRGLRTFNLGSSNQTPLQTEVLLRSLLDTLRPRLVVFEVHPDIMSHDGVEAAIYQLCNVPPCWSMVPMALRTHNVRVWATAAYAIPHNLCSDEFKRFSEPQGSYVPGGYVEHEPACYSPQPIPATLIQPLPRQLRALRRCMRLFHQRGIPSLLLEVPDTRAMLQAYTNLGDFQSEMSTYGDFRFLPLSTLDDSLHFYDREHLNTDGVELYNNYLCDSIIIPILSKL